MSVNYPNLKKAPTTKRKIVKSSIKASLGMALEHDIDATNLYYLDKKIAVIWKKPTAIRIYKVDYEYENNQKIPIITKAKYSAPSTTDYNGVYKGKYIDFDAKETIFDYLTLKNIHAHQVEHLRAITYHGGIGFLIVGFINYHEYYLLPVEVLLEYWDNKKNKGARQSIPIEVFRTRAYPIKFSYMPRLDYLKIIDIHYFKE